MSEPHVSLDRAALSPTEARLREPLEEQLSSALQAAAGRVRDSYHGEPVEVVEERLLAETRSGLHPDIAEGFSPDRGQLRKVAQAVIDAAGGGDGSAGPPAAGTGR